MDKTRDGMDIDAVGAQAGRACGFGILGLGVCLPQKTLTNKDFEAFLDTTDEWIVQRTGISERRIAAEGETTATMAICAAEAALADAGVAGGDIGLVIVATATPDSFAPATAPLVQHAIGAKDCAAFDLNAGCTGSLYALVTAHNFLRGGSCGHALVIGAETLSRATDWKNRKSCILFGDGAGAAVLGPVAEGAGFVASMLRSDGEGADLITIPAFTVSEADLARRNGVKTPTIWLDGNKVMKFASRAMSAAVIDVTAGAGIGVGDVKLIVPHQANIRIIDSAAKRLGLDKSKVFVNLGKYGNTSAASILIALYEATGAGLLVGGDYVVLVAFGAGLTYGAILMRM